MDHNPLKQYFRRPAVYIKLPSGGKNYTPDIVDMPETGDLPVYPMTAIDEITTRTPDALFNGTAVVDLIKSCVPNIKNPWLITGDDIDTILIGIRAASNGDTLDIDSTCPNCSETATYGLNLVSVLSTLKGGAYEDVLDLGDLKIKLRPLTYKEMNESATKQFEIQRMFSQINAIEDIEEREKMGVKALEQITELTMDLLSCTIEYIETPNVKVDEKPYILDFLRNCDRKVYTQLRDKSGELKSSTEIQPMDIECSSCHHQYKEPININPVDFFG